MRICDILLLLLSLLLLLPLHLLLPHGVPLMP